MDLAQEIYNKIKEAENMDIQPLIPITFEPFSFIIISELQKLKSRIEKNRLFNSILNDPRAEVLNENNGYKTSIFKNHNTRDQYWPNTKSMAIALNENEIDVSFLPEDGDVPKGIKRADAIIRINNQWKIADFKYFISTNDNTLSDDLKNGFSQANVIVLKMQNANSGVLREAIEYLKRNKLRIGDIILLNEYDKVIYLKDNCLKSDKYRIMIKGFLK